MQSENRDLDQEVVVDPVDTSSDEESQQDEPLNPSMMTPFTASGDRSGDREFKK